MIRTQDAICITYDLMSDGSQLFFLERVPDRAFITPEVIEGLNTHRSGHFSYESDLLSLECANGKAVYRLRSTHPHVFALDLVSWEPRDWK